MPGARAGWKQLQRRASERVAPPLAAAVLRPLYRTLRREFVRGAIMFDRWRERRPAIYVFWHGRMLLVAPIYGGAHLHVLISLHHDGELIARVVRRLGLDTVRGSTRAGASGAAKRMVRLLRAGDDVAITPDGPRGPRYVVAPGLIDLARLAGVPIVPVAASCERGLVLGSWDRFVIPAPFTRCVYHVGEPVAVPRDAGPEARAALHARVEGDLRELTARADLHYDRPWIARATGSLDVERPAPA